MTRKRLRVYPPACTSAHCGKTTCPPKCPNLPRLQDFKAWREDTGAIVEDPIWCPTVWTAQR